jgi:outer membrane protein assembly factor BamB
VLIDLGEDWSVVADRPSRRRPLSMRTLLAVLLVITTLLVVGGSTVPRSHFAELVSIATPRNVSAAVEVGNGGLFVGLWSTGTRQVARYGLSDGRRTWARSVAFDPQILRYVFASDTVLIEGVEGGQGRVSVLDAATGDSLWTAAGSSRLGLGAAGSAVPLLTDDPSGSIRLRYIDLRTGQTVWSTSAPAGTMVLPAAVGDHREVGAYLEVRPDGVTRLLDQSTGAVMATGQVGSIALPGTQMGLQLLVVGHNLVVLRNLDGFSVSVTAYQLSDLRQRWQRVGGYTAGHATDCGPVVCVALVQASGVVGLDPATGTTRWQASGYWEASLIAADRLLAHRAAFGGVGVLGRSDGILDAYTGQLLVDLGDWSPLDPSAQAMTAPDPNDPSHTLFGTLNPATGRLRPVGWLPADVTYCRSPDDLLLCTTSDGVRIWRYLP